MTTLSADTRPDAERVQIELLRKAPAWRKLHMVAQMNRTLRTLALCGLRERYPMPCRMSCVAAWPICGSGLNWPRRFIARPHTSEWKGNWPMSEKPLEEPIAVTLLVIDALEALGVPYFGVPQAIASNC